MAQEGEGTVYVEQRQQDCGASATEEGARALRQTAHTDTHTYTGKLLHTAWHRNDTAIDQANKSVQTQRKKIKCQTSIMLEVPGSPESYEETTDRLCTSFTQ